MPLLVGQALPCPEEQPALAAADSPQFGSGPKQDLPADFVDGFAGALHDVEGVVDDGRVGKVGIAADGGREGLGTCQRK
jgi:hypothetical protein